MKKTLTLSAIVALCLTSVAFGQTPAKSAMTKKMAPKKSSKMTKMTKKTSTKMTPKKTMKKPSAMGKKSG